MYPASCTTNANQQLAYPHYSNQLWEKPQLIYHDGCVKPCQRGHRRINSYHDNWLSAFDEPAEDSQFDFKAAPKTDECNYSDRIWQWDYKKAEDASKQCQAEGLNQRTAKGIERFLCLYHDRPITLKYVLGGVNVSNGYEYYVYGYNYK